MADGDLSRLEWALVAAGLLLAAGSDALLKLATMACRACLSPGPPMHHSCGASRCAPEATRAANFC